MKILDPNLELISTKIKYFETELSALDEALDRCDQELESLDNPNIPFSTDKLDKLTGTMSILHHYISVFRSQLNYLLVSISN